MTYPALLIQAAILTTAVAGAQNPPSPGETPGTPSSAPEPAELAALREQYAARISAADRAVLRQWIASLAALEESRAAAGNYDGALEARRRREAALSVAGADDGRMTLQLTDGNLTKKGSGLTVDDKHGTIMLRSGGAFLEWDLSGEFEGWYEVKLEHAVAGSRDETGSIEPTTGPVSDRRGRKSGAASRAGGAVSFQSLSNLSRNNVSLRREIVSTGGWNAWRTVSLGKFHVPARVRIAKFRLTADEAGSDALMHFRRLELVPTTPPPVAGDNGAGLARARETFEKELRTRLLSAGATARYAAALATLETQATKAGDIDAQARIREEKSRLAQMPEKLVLGTGEVSAAANSSVTLDVGDPFKCQFRGEVRPDSTRTSLTSLRPAGSASVTWRLGEYRVPSGTYHIAIRGRVPVNGGGSATLAAFGRSGASAGPVLEFGVKPVVTVEARNKKPAEGAAAPAAEIRSVEPGKIVIGKGAETLTLTVTGLVHNDGWLMDISGLVLTRTGDASPSP